MEEMDISIDREGQCNWRRDRAGRRDTKLPPSFPYLSLLADHLLVFFLPSCFPLAPGASLSVGDALLASLRLRARLLV